jgi:hypothetical protein
MCETLLMGLEGLSSDGSTGSVTEEGVRRTLGWAEKHGFRLGDLSLTRAKAHAVSRRRISRQAA